MDMRDVVCGKTRVLLGLAFVPPAESGRHLSRGANARRGEANDEKRNRG